MAKLSQFEHGYLCAVATLQTIEGSPSLAADILKQAGFSDRDCSELDEMDKVALREVNKEADMDLQGLE